jgi:hypothetical protein
MNFTVLGENKEKNLKVKKYFGKGTCAVCMTGKTKREGHIISYMHEKKAVSG